MGIRAAEAAVEGDHGMMVASIGEEMVLVPLSSAVEEPRSVPGARLDEVDWFLV
jgi:6-phosphofructokinase